MQIETKFSLGDAVTITQGNQPVESGIVVGIWISADPVSYKLSVGDAVRWGVESELAHNVGAGS